MLPDTANRRFQALPEISKQGKRVNGLFRLLENPGLWQQAYGNIYANAGAATKGVDEVTMDGFSMERVANLIELLKEGRYHPKPVRRAYIPKANGKQRPLGIPSGDDKLVQEVARIILEQIYEPVFSDRSHGFRPNKSCHTALKQVERWDGVKWLVEVDIQGFYDNIDHDLLIKMLKKKIDDPRFIDLIQAMLKAGYVEEWKLHRTYSGTPQGGIVSPILANIYLHELDMFMETLKAEFDKGRVRSPNREYHRYGNRIYDRRKEIRWREQSGEDNSPEIQELRRQIKELDNARKKLPSVDPHDMTYRRLYYCRYADDSLMGIIGSKEDAQAVMARVRAFIEKDLNLAIAEEKSKVSHAEEGTIFLGYEIIVQSSDRLVKERRGRTHTLVRTISKRMHLRIPEEKLQKFCHEKGYGTYNTPRSLHRPGWLNNSDAEIVMAYNAEMRGLANYYSLAYNAKRRLSKLYFVWRGSLLKTLASKHQLSVTQVARQIRWGSELAVKFEVRGKPRYATVFTLKTLKIPQGTWNAVDAKPNVRVFAGRTEVVQRLNADTCEYCGTTQGYFEVHHVRKLSDVADGKRALERQMMAMRRKTLVLCVNCHQLLHQGKLPDWRQRRHIEVESRMR
jgi:RNA-directed DNA polymerase